MYNCINIFVFSLKRKREVERMIAKKWYTQIIQFNFTTWNISCHIIIIIHVTVQWSPFCCHIVTHKVKSMGSVRGKWEEGSSTTPSSSSSSTDQHRHNERDERTNARSNRRFYPDDLKIMTLFHAFKFELNAKEFSLRISQSKSLSKFRSCWATDDNVE